ncbi:hypothetical protein ARTHRO9AX_30108 [Arthrobacter sp. 9AX]|nr:hypothetical protein ARTHRO9AX_30108 [Arthrobacter sp. 9AX]
MVKDSDEAAIHTYHSNLAATRYLSHEPLSVAPNRERLTKLLALARASQRQSMSRTLHPSGSSGTPGSGMTRLIPPTGKARARAFPC